MININKLINIIANMSCVKKVRAIIFEKQFKRKIGKIRERGKECIFFMATPCHGNLGDQAIVYSQYELMKKVGVKDRIVEVSNKNYFKYREILRKYIEPKDVIIIDGGGNLGTLWPREDDKISDIINTYYNNKIVVFPQTIYYDDTSEAKIRLRKNYSIYSKAKKLIITLRDEKSYNFFEQHFCSVNKLYIPDIVLAISDLSFEHMREGCLLCFREDLEKNISDKEIEDLKIYLKSQNIIYTKTSTIIKNSVNKRTRNKVLINKWKEFSKAELLITDRLHGMIFAAITGTSCLALDNSSKKVSGVYEWIRDHKYIKVCNNMDEVKKEISNMLELKNNSYTGSELKEFKELMKVIKDE